MNDKIPFHKHTGTDGSPKIPLRDIEFQKQGAIDSPTGGLVIDGEARSAIDSIRVALRNLGLTN